MKIEIQEHMVAVGGPIGATRVANDAFNESARPVEECDCLDATAGATLVDLELKRRLASDAVCKQD